ncbi:4-alpha-glucanotransferase [Hollandina sp. SP2]
MDHILRFILGSHYHIPYGVGDDEFEAAYKTNLKPFVSTLYQYPKIQATLHYSGVLLYWLEKTHPEFFMLLEDLVSRKQIELLGGGFYEPMMPLIPLSDKIGQIEMLTTYLRKHFGKRPQGCRLPALAWEPHIVGPLSTCGMSYTFLEERQFILAGVGAEVIEPCITEDQGKLITIFPVSNRFKEAFAQRRASLVLEDWVGEQDHSDELVQHPPGGGKKLICVFPEQLFAENGASESVEIRFHRFFEDLSRFESRIEFTSPGKLFKGLRGLKKIYFPVSQEAGALSGERDAHPAVRQFLIDYPEANHIYAKMMFTHILINQLRGDKSRKRIAREELWKAQGFDAFCPGAYGGVCRHSIRKAAYKALLEAEKISREQSSFIPSVLHFDFDLDGEGEYLFRNGYINCYIQLKGAAVFELDYLPKVWNYLDTFAPGFRRTSFADYLVSPELTFQDTLEGVLQSPQARFTHRYCGGEPFELVSMDKEHEQVHFRLPVHPGLPYGNIELEKRYQIRKDTLKVTYVLINRGTSTETGRFIPSLDLSFSGEEESFVRLVRLPAAPRGLIPEEPETASLALEEMVITDAEGITLEDLKNEVFITLKSDLNFDAWIVPIRTPCPIQGALHQMYQSTCIMPIRPFLLEPGDCLALEFSLRIY